MRENRPRGPEMSPEARQRAIARSYARVYVQRGKLIPTPCPCGCTGRPLETHHEDYSKPLEVTFCCAEYHQVLDNARFARLRAAEQLPVGA